MMLIIPNEIFDYILNFVKAEKYNITTLRRLSRTCKLLNSTLHHDIVNWQRKYHVLYDKFEVCYRWTPKCSYINEIILDGLLHNRTSCDSIIEEAINGLNDNSMSDISIALCRAAVFIGNIELVRMISQKCVNNWSVTLGVCAGHSKNHEMFEYFKRLNVKYSFWSACIVSALWCDNVGFLEYCHGNGMSDVIDGGVNGVVNGVSLDKKCHGWLVEHYYLHE